LRIDPARADRALPRCRRRQRIPRRRNKRTLDSVEMGGFRGRIQKEVAKRYRRAGSKRERRILAVIPTGVRRSVRLNRGYQAGSAGHGWLTSTRAGPSWSGLVGGLLLVLDEVLVSEKVKLQGWMVDETRHRDNLGFRSQREPRARSITIKVAIRRWVNLRPLIPRVG